MWWLILLIPFALIALILLIRFRLCLVFEDDLNVKIRVLLFNFSLYPQKKEKLKPSDYSIKNLKKRKGNLSKKRKKVKPKKSAEHKKDKATQIKDILELIKIIFENVASPFGKYLKIEIVKIHAKIATNDPAKTAIIYGLASQSVAYIIEYLSNITNVDVKKKSSIQVYPDFVSETSEAKINITLGLKGWHALFLATKFFMAYNLHKNKKKNINSLETQEEKLYEQQSQ